MPVVWQVGAPSLPHGHGGAADFIPLKFFDSSIVSWQVVNDAPVSHRSSSLVAGHPFDEQLRATEITSKQPAPASGAGQSGCLLASKSNRSTWRAAAPRRRRDVQIKPTPDMSSFLPSFLLSSTEAFSLARPVSFPREPDQGIRN